MTPVSEDYVRSILTESATVKSEFAATCSKDIARLVDVLRRCLLTGNKVLVFGNGGSAADAQHFAAELTGKFRNEHRRALPVLAPTNLSEVTAVGNDFGYDIVFARFVEAFAKPGDVVIGISTSGNSLSVLHAVDAAKKAGCTTVAWCGSGGLLASVVDIAIRVPSHSTPRIQECHVALLHVVAELVEATFSESGNQRT